MALKSPIFLIEWINKSGEEQTNTIGSVLAGGLWGDVGKLSDARIGNKPIPFRYFVYCEWC